MYCLSPTGLIARKDGSLCDVYVRSGTPLSTFYKLLEIERRKKILAAIADYWRRKEAAQDA